MWRIAHQVFALIGLFHQLAAQTVNRLALLIHDVVILEQVFARFKVSPFYRLLRRLNAFGNHLRLDGNTFLHPQTLHQCLDLVTGKDAHQVVFERKEKARRARVSLAPGTTAELIINPP